MFKYKNQIKDLRCFALKQLGAEKVAIMNDLDIEEWVKKEYDLCYEISDDGICDKEIIYALPKGTLEKAVHFSR